MKVSTAPFRMILWLALAVSISPVFGAVEPAGIFTDSMVLQRDMRVPVWGWAVAGEQITIVFNGQTVQAAARDSTITAYQGYWKAWLQPMSAGGPFDMTVTGSQSGAVSLKGILVGDVWVCSGQSNMNWSMNHVGTPETSPEVQTLPADNQPMTQLRLCQIGNCLWTNPALDIRKTELNWGDGARSSWRSCSRALAKDYAQTAALFGVLLQRKINIPVGIITASVSATPLRLWVSPELADTIDFKMCGQNPGASIAARTPVRFGTWQNSELPGCCYNGLINPLLGMAIKGVAWWQGEQESWDASPVCAYSTGGFPKLIKEWRRKWSQGDFPFIYVQIQQSISGSSSINEVRDAQLKALNEPNTAMTAIFDSCNTSHPENKLVPAKRLVLAAGGLAYKENIEYMGPIYDSMILQGSSIRIRFAHASGGLVKKGIAAFQGDNNLAVGPKVLSSSSDPNAPFEIAGADNVYRNADAVIDSNTVIVSAPGVSAPKNVRYGIEVPGLAKTPLFNTSNLPASMFRTATWAGLNSPPTGVSNGLKGRAISPAERSLTLSTTGGLIMLRKEFAGKTAAVNLYTVKGQFLRQIPSGPKGMVKITGNKIGSQIVIARNSAAPMGQ